MISAAYFVIGVTIGTLSSLHVMDFDYSDIIHKIQGFFVDLTGFYDKEWHNDRYLAQCYYNLQEKYDCGGISEDEWQKIEDFYRERSALVECNVFDKETTYTDCTVQILENSVTGETSVGWWRNE